MNSAILRKVGKGTLVAVVSFVGLGTVAALWDNPLFIRMTPAGGWEIGLLAALSVTLGVYTAIRRPWCSIKAAGSGGLLGFLGVACPICNKVLVLVFGGELLLAYYEPMRIYIAVLGLIIALLVLWREWRAVGRQMRESGRDDVAVGAAGKVYDRQ